MLAIRNLQHAYGYYLDKCLYEEVVDLFAEDGQVIFIGGIYSGRPGIARLYTGRFRSRFAGGVNGPAPGRSARSPADCRTSSTSARTGAPGTPGSGP